MRDPVGELVEALSADGEMQQMKIYLEEGRAYGSLAVEKLNGRWVAALTAVSHGDDTRLDEWSDLAAELRLRRLPLPEHLVQIPSRRASRCRWCGDSCSTASR